MAQLSCRRRRPGMHRESQSLLEHAREQEGMCGMSIAPAWMRHFLCGSYKLGKALYQLIYRVLPQDTLSSHGFPSGSPLHIHPGYVSMGALKGREEVSLQLPSSSLLFSRC